MKHEYCSTPVADEVSSSAVSMSLSLTRITELIRCLIFSRALSSMRAKRNEDAEVDNNQPQWSSNVEICSAVFPW